MNRSRLLYLGLAVTTIALGLSLTWWGHGLPAGLRDALGDALWALMMYWLVGVAAPQAARLRRAVLALIICWVVEASQLLHTAQLDLWRETTLGRLVLGSDFDPRDLVAYGLGVLVGLKLDLTLLRRAVVN